MPRTKGCYLSLCKIAEEHSLGKIYQGLDHWYYVRLSFGMGDVVGRGRTAKAALEAYFEHIKSL